MQDAWYTKLRLEGFEDVEVMVQGELSLRRPDYMHYRVVDEDELGTKSASVEAYYYALNQKLEAEIALFRNEVDRLILSCFAMGTKITRIVEILAREGKPRCRNTIMFTIRRYEMQWGLRAYTRKQLNRRAKSA